MDGPDDVSIVAEEEAPGQLDADLVQYDNNKTEDTTPKPPKTYDWPEAAPFTAYIGNLAYSVDEPGKLAEEVTKLAKEMLNMEVTVVDSRLSRANNSLNRHHRDNNNEAENNQKPHRGFGYVELETLEQLKAVVEGLGGGKIAGRNIQLDTANMHAGRQNRNEGGQQVDGSRFRGGKYNHNKDRRQPPQQQQEEGPPRQRSSLKLQPRTKPIEENPGSERGNLFGGGRPREEGTWQSQRDTDKKSHGGGRGAKAGGRRNGREEGGRNNGREEGGRGDGAGRGRREGFGTHKVTDKKVKEVKKTTGPAVPAPRPENVEKPVPKPAGVINRFAALEFDSD